MTFELSFSRREKYDPLATGINLETKLYFGELFINCDAKVDTGADVCLFQRGIGEAIGIPIEKGVKKRLATLTGALTAYGHEVVLEMLGLQLQTVVYFAESDDVNRNILGRQGWLQLLKLGIVDYDNELYLGLYDE
jgi:hypothetical protein